MRILKSVFLYNLTQDNVFNDIMYYSNVRHNISLGIYEHFGKDFRVAIRAFYVVSNCFKTHKASCLLDICIKIICGC